MELEVFRPFKTGFTGLTGLRGEKVVKSAADLAVDDTITINYQDGTAKAKILETQLHQKGE